MTAGAVVAIVGPTASGKSDRARDAARDLGAEIVAIDAFSLYRGMDVGTAKPSLGDRRRVPHHLVDVVDPSDEVSVAWFQSAARAAVAAIHDRGRTALLVGGSGLYFRAVVDPLEFPPTDIAVRARIEDGYRDRPGDAHAALVAVDPVAAAKIDPSNLRRSVRALEVIELTGRAFSSFAEAWTRYESIYPTLEVIGVDRPDADLRARIEQRAEAMVAGGLLDEVQRLLAAPRPLSRTAAQAIGYAEAMAALRGEIAADDLARMIADRTWRYARRQRSWFRQDPRVQGAHHARAGRTLEASIEVK